MANANIGTISATLRANTAQFLGPMRQAEMATAGVSGALRRLAAQATGGFGLYQAAKFIVDTNRELERLRAQLETVTGSAEHAANAFAFVEQFAKQTPFQIEDVTKAFLRLGTVGINPTADVLTDFGNIASAWGRNVEDFAQAVQSAVARETEALKGFGIVMRVDGEKTRLIFKGQTREFTHNAQNIKKALQDIAKEHFGGGMARQMNTLNGILSNIKDNFGILARQAGEVLRPLLADMAKWVEDVTGKTAQHRAEVVAWTRTTIAGVKAIVVTFASLARAAYDVGQIVGSALGGPFTMLFGAMRFDLNLVERGWKMMTQSTTAALKDIGKAGGAIGETWAEFSLELEKARDTTTKAAPPMKAALDKVNTGLKDVTDTASQANLELQKLADHWRDKLKTPMEKFGEGLVELNELYRKGLIGASELARGQAMLLQEYRDSQKPIEKVIDANDELAAQWRERLKTPLEKFTEAMAELTKLNLLGKLSTEEMVRAQQHAAKEYKQAMDETQQKVKEAAATFSEIGESMGEGLVRGFVDSMLNGFKNIKDVLLRVFSRAIEEVVVALVKQTGIIEKLAGAVAGIFGGGGGRRGGKKPSLLGGLVGGAIGFLAGGPAGAVIGAGQGANLLSGGGGPSLTVSFAGMGNPASPIAMARDKQHIELWMRTADYAQKMGYNMRIVAP